MKKPFVFFMIAAMLFSFAACAEAENEVSQTEAPAEPAETVTESAEAAPKQEATQSKSDAKILIAYFTAAENSDVDAVSSASVVTVNGEAKGCVQAVAEMIQAGTGGELFSIQTDFDYPGHIGQLIDYADSEQERNERPTLATHIENLADYDVIFIGYPNWWYDMPMAMYSFFEEYDFSGKTIIPFNTHRGSRFSSTISTIGELEPNATVLEDGFTFPGDNAADAADDVAAWLKTIAY